MKICVLDINIALIWSCVIMTISRWEGSCTAFPIVECEDMRMKRKTVKKRIFISNALMIFVTLVLVFIINIGVAKLYWESIEQDWQTSMETMADTANMEDMLEDWTLHQQSFYVLFLVDMLVCAAIWILVSLFFTRGLVRQIMKPLDALGQGAKRIRENELTEAIYYQGDEEFEEICRTFNDMQTHILLEQEKNRKYEKARTEMIAGISHDLRTPLTAVRGTIKGILDGVVKEEKQQKKFLQTAYRRTGDMDVLLNQLFYVSKLETGNMPMHLQRTNLFSWISKYLEGKREILAGEEVEFEERLEKVSDTVLIDQEQFQRIFDNLLENSRKYGGIKPIRIAITLEEVEKGFLICFSDNGQGVPEEKLEFIFDEFYRADESRNKKEGNGLGLYIVKNLMKSMGGQAWAENRHGLSIYMKLPKGE